MDMGRESRWEKDAMTVEIVFALVTAVAPAVAVFAVAPALALAFGISGSAKKGVLVGARCSERRPECGVWYGCCVGSTSNVGWAADCGPLLEAAGLPAMAGIVERLGPDDLWELFQQVVPEAPTRRCQLG